MNDRFIQFDELLARLDFKGAVASLLFGFHSYLLTHPEIYCEIVEMKKRTAMTMFYTLSNAEPCWRKK